MKRVLLVIGGGIAAYKCLDLIRRLRERGHAVRCVMTKAAQEFITPLAVGAISNDRVATELFDLDTEREIGHIRLAREADIVVVAPATADLLARMAQGHANDLATAVLLATRAPILAAPAMNPAMWSHAATRRNVRQLEADGVSFIGPNAGEMAERGEAGVGRMAEVPELIDRIEEILAGSGSESGFGFLNVSTSGRSRAAQPSQPLAGRHVLVTSGPTHEPIDPVRYIANRSSGKQGHAIADAARRLGARVTLISGPVQIADPDGVDVRHVETAGGGRGGATGGHSGICGSSCRLARGCARARQDQEDGGRGSAVARAGGKPRYPRHCCQARHAPPVAGGRIRGGNAVGGRERQDQAQGKRRRLDLGQ
jgi:phosphopantothenoylcysteine decarboxylase/phosphopantothenate--cysteine ligase